MKYAWLNKYPARRSAYTCTERPSRLDLCKERYGGPFTTGEVEDVKSFWRILAVLLSMFGLFSFDTSAGVANHYYRESNSSNYSYIMDKMSFTEVVIILYPSTITYGSLFLCVLTLQLLFIPFFSKCLPRLLCRMGMGLFVGLCASISLTLFSVWLDKELFPYGLLVIPQVLYGCTYFLTFVTSIEFIVAQAPLRMQGILIGLFTQFAGCSIVLSATLTSMTTYWFSYTIKGILALLSCLIFLIAALKYKYRERNEATDVNERLIIAEYYERQINRGYSEVKDELVIY